MAGRARTLDQVETLFKWLHKGSEDDATANDTYDQWKQYINDSRESINEYYKDDGCPTVYGFDGTNGIKVAVYRYGKVVDTDHNEPGQYRLHSIEGASGRRRLVTMSQHYKPIDWAKVKGVIVHCHGIAENARFNSLATKAFAESPGYPTANRYFSAEECEEMKTTLDARTSAAYLVYETSWIQSLIDAGYVMFVMDLQGHGLSEAWAGSRCNCSRVEDLVRDLVSLTVICYQNEMDHKKPLFLTGLSLGGCVLARALQIGHAEGEFRTKGDTEESKPLISGALFWCPALSADRLRRKFPNNIFLLFGKLLSRYTPRAKVAKLETNVRFPYITHLVRKDPLVYTEPVPVRIGYDVFGEQDKILENIHHIPDSLRILVIQSKHDTMVDPEGSERFLKALSNPDKGAIFLEYAWHYLSKEPGYASIISHAIQWFDQTFDSKA